MSNRHKSRFLVTTGLIGVATMFHAAPVAAQAYGIHHTATDRLAVENGAGETIEGQSIGIFAERGPIDLTNAGTVRGNGVYDGFDAPPDAGVTIAQGGSSVVNSGTISGGNAGITTAYFYNPNTQALEGLAIGTTVENSGSIIGDNNDGVRLIGGGSVINSGLIAGRVGAFADGVSMYAFEGQDTSGQTSIGSLTNQAGGTIEGARFGAILSGGGVIDNAGTMRGGAGAILIQAVRTDAGKTATIVNSGTLTGGDAVSIAGSIASASLINSGQIEGTGAYGVHNAAPGSLTVTNAAGGVIDGAKSGIFGQEGAVVVDNAGTIVGRSSYDGFDAEPDSGIVLAVEGSSVTNSGTITGAGTGVGTAYYYDAATDSLVPRAIGTTVTNSGTITGENNDGVRLIGGGTVTNGGTIQGLTGQFTDGVSMFAFNGQDTSGQTSIGTVTNQAGGSITGQRFGIILTGGGVIDNAGTIGGGVGSVVIQGVDGGRSATLANSGTLSGGVILNTDTNSLVNTGAIASETGPAVEAYGATTLDNAGSIAGANGLAVQFDITDDALILRTGSSIVGAVDAGEGIDSVTLVGTSAAATEAQRVGQLANFEELEVRSGYWSTAGAVGSFASVAIGAEATLKVTEINADQGGESPIDTSVVVNDGLLVLDFSQDDVVSALDNLSISGSGGVRLEGPAVFTVDTDNLTYTGTTTIADGGIVLTGSLQGDVVTAGNGVFQLGSGDTDGTFAGDIVNDGTFVFNRSDDYDFLGDFSGTGLLTKMGAGTLTFTGGYSFTGATSILAGAVKIAGAIDPETEFALGDEGQLDVSGTAQTIGALSGTEGSEVIIDDSTLTVDQEEDTDFAGVIEGDGSIVKDGEGILNLTGDSSYTGDTIVSGGTLAVNGSIVSDVTVNGGGTLGGNGQVGDTSVAAGGKIGPGNSIGRLTVNGDLDFAAGSIYEVEANAAAEADRIDATGAVTIASGAAVEVLAENGNYRPRTDYTILTAGSGITGTFGSVTSNLAFLSPILSYGANAVTLSLYRNDTDFADVAVSFNQAATATAVQALGIGDPIFEDVLIQNEAGAQAAFDALSGEVHASTLAALAEDSRHVRDAMLRATEGADDGAFVWGSALGSWGDFDGNDGAAGVGSSDYDVDARSSSSDADSRFVGLHGSYEAGPLRAAIGGAYSWHDIETGRSVDFASIAQTLESEYDAKSLQLFGELSYRLDVGGFGLSPFARLAHVSTETDGFAETGGSAALVADEADQDVNFLTLGVAARVNRSAMFQPRISVGWRHGWGDLNGEADLRFAGGTQPFTIVGARIPEDAAAIDAGFDLDLGRVSIGGSYVGSLAKDWSSHGLRAKVQVAF